MATGGIPYTPLNGLLMMTLLESLDSTRGGTEMPLLKQAYQEFGGKPTTTEEFMAFDKVYSDVTARAAEAHRLAALKATSAPIVEHPSEDITVRIDRIYATRMPEAMKRSLVRKELTKDGYSPEEISEMLAEQQQQQQQQQQTPKRERSDSARTPPTKRQEMPNGVKKSVAFQEDDEDPRSLLNSLKPAPSVGGEDSSIAEDYGEEH